MWRSLAALIGPLTIAGCASAPGAPEYNGRPCTQRPHGHLAIDCRIALHGTPDLSRNARLDLRGAETTLRIPITRLKPGTWRLTDSLGLPMGTLHDRTLADLNGKRYAVDSITVRGKGCTIERDRVLVQLVARRARASGTQAFVPIGALPRAAYDQVEPERGPGCGPTRPARGPTRPLTNPDVGPHAHARLGNGQLNTVTEYDAKPDFGNVVYLSSNTTEVHVGGITRGMVRVGTPVRTVDRFDYCDPNSDGTLTWRYLAIRAAGQQLYGWVPARCPRAWKTAGADAEDP